MIRRRRRRVRYPLTLAMLGLIAAGAGVSLSTGNADPPPADERPPEPIVCRGHDQFVREGHFDLGLPQDDGPPTPEDARDELLDNYFPHLKGRFTAEERMPERARFALREGRELRGEVTVVLNADSWAVSGFRGCDATFTPGGDREPTPTASASPAAPEGDGGAG